MARRSTTVEERTGNGPGGRQLLPGETVPMSPEQAARLGALVERYDARVRRVARSRLYNMGMPWTRALIEGDDIAQNTWARLALNGRRDGDVLGDTPVSVPQTEIRLFLELRLQVHQYFKPLRVRNEVPTCDDAPVWRDRDNEQPAVEPLWSEHSRAMLERLDPGHRAAMVEFCHGVPYVRIGELLGVTTHTAARFVQRATEALSATPVPVEDLPEGQRAAVRALPDDARELVLLSLAGLSNVVIAARLGLDTRTVRYRLDKYGHAVDGRVGLTITPIDPAAVESLTASLPHDRRAALEELPERTRVILVTRAAGGTLEQCALRAGVGVKAVALHLKRHGHVLDVGSAARQAVAS